MYTFYYYTRYYTRFQAFYRTVWVSRYRKGKTSLDLNEARDDGVFGWQRHQLDHMQTFEPHSRQTATQTPHHSNFTG